MGAAYEFFRRGIAALSRLTGDPLNYYQDGLYTTHCAAFLQDPKFKRAYALACATAHGHGKHLHIEWRVYVCCWAAVQALQHEGDFVECGVNAGMLSRAVTDYVDFGTLPRRFYLMDTFAGLPTEQLLPEEIKMGFRARYAYSDTYETTRAAFAKYPNVEFIKGRIPDTLSEMPSKQMAYLSIDMNAVVPEIAAVRHFWDVLVPGGIIVLDDYNWRRHAAQRAAFDAFAREREIMVLALPTGQGLIVKPRGRSTVVPASASL